MAQRGARDGLGDGREVVGQAYDAQRVADLRSRGEVAEPGTGEGERLAHRARDEQVAVLRRAAPGRTGCPARRNSAYASSITTTPGAISHSLPDHVVRQRGAGRVVRRRQQDHARPVLVDQPAGLVEVEAEVLVPAPGDPGGHRVAGVLRIHRVRRGEADRGPPGTTEGLQDLQHHLVGAVGRPDLVGGQLDARLLREVGGQTLAQLGELAVGVAVQRRGRPRRPPRRCRRPRPATAGRGSR